MVCSFVNVLWFTLGCGSWAFRAKFNALVFDIKGIIVTFAAP